MVRFTRLPRSHLVAVMDSQPLMVIGDRGPIQSDMKGAQSVSKTVLFVCLSVY